MAGDTKTWRIASAERDLKRPCRYLKTNSLNRIYERRNAYEER